MNSIKEYINSLPNDKESIGIALNNNSIEVIEQIRNEITKGVEFDQEDYIDFVSLIPEKESIILKECDRILNLNKGTKTM